MHIDKILTDIGGFGKYQVFVCLVTGLVWIMVAFNHLGIVYVADTPDFQCNSPVHWDANYSWIFYKGEEYQEKNHTYSQDQCFVYRSNVTAVLKNNESALQYAKCKSWEFDRSRYTSTIVSTWNLVCERKWLVSIASSVYMSGLLVGVWIIGILADKFGRRITLIGSLFGLVCMEFGVTFSPNMTAFIIFRFLLAFFTQGMGSCSYIIGMEYVSPDRRLVPWVITGSVWSISIVFMALLAYAIRHWRMLQLAYSCMGVVILIICGLLIPESARWLYAAGRISDGEKMIRKVAKMNKKSNQLPMKIHITVKGNQKTKPLELLKTPEIRKRSLIMFFYWTVASFVYFGLFLNIGKLSFNIYLGLIISGILELVKDVAMSPIVHYFGRRWPTVVTVFGSGVCLLCIPIFSPDHWMVQALSVTGRLTIGAAFSCAYLYSCELFPTLLRSAAVGTSSMFARFGAIFAPLIGHLDVVHPVIPPVIFGSSAIVAGILAWFLPETKGQLLPDTVDDVENPKSRTRTFDDIAVNGGDSATAREDAKLMELVSSV